jgi:energy-coupling factor transporter ATP-binding protein EcfA2
MDDALLDAILDRLATDPLADASTGLLLAACEGQQAIDAAVAGNAPARPTRAEPAVPGSHDAVAAVKPAGAYLRSITVRAFRGIGAESTLSLQPGNGLTVIVGRNGSGKSSFAEALEVLLTASTDRFDRTAIYRSGWCNLHDTGPTTVAATMHVAGAPGTTSAERTWAAGADLDAGVATVQLPGEKRTDLAALGWGTALTVHRPFLSHAELEAMLSKPSELYDRLATVLGLESWRRADLSRLPRRWADSSIRCRRGRHGRGEVDVVGIDLVARRQRDHATTSAGTRSRRFAWRWGPRRQ